MTAIPITRLCATHRGPHTPTASHGHICTTCHKRFDLAVHRDAD